MMLAILHLHDAISFDISMFILSFAYSFIRFAITYSYSIFSFYYFSFFACLSLSLFTPTFRDIIIDYFIFDIITFIIITPLFELIID